MLADTEFKSAAQLTCQECVEGAMLAERLGFSAVWKGEGNNRTPGVVLSARISRIAVSGGVNHVFARLPVSFGVEAATLNELAEGRYIARLGVGNETVVRWQYSTNRAPSKIMREYGSVVRRVYAGERREGEVGGSPGPDSGSPSLRRCGSACGAHGCRACRVRSPTVCWSKWAMPEWCSWSPRTVPSATVPRSAGRGRCSWPRSSACG